jgi:hypothetical protein
MGKDLSVANSLDANTGRHAGRKDGRKDDRMNASSSSCSQIRRRKEEIMGKKFGKNNEK